jgi:hypothetical protein
VTEKRRWDAEAEEVPLRGGAAGARKPLAPLPSIAYMVDEVVEVGGSGFGDGWVARHERWRRRRRRRRKRRWRLTRA